jgi:hypothetical protein
MAGASLFALHLQGLVAGAGADGSCYAGMLVGWSTVQTAHPAFASAINKTTANDGVSMLQQHFCAERISANDGQDILCRFSSATTMWIKLSRC